MYDGKITIWGDSIFKGVIFDEARGRYAILRDNFVTALSRVLGISVDNRARMGLTSAGGEAEMTPDAFSPGALAVIEFGGNDCDLDWQAVAAAPEAAHEAKVPLDEFRARLTALAQRARAGGMRPVLVTPPPLCAQRYFDWVTRGLDAQAVLRYLGDVDHIYRWQERYADAVYAVAARTGSALFDLRDAFLQAGDLPSLMCADGIHPNARGHALMASAARARLATI